MRTIDEHLQTVNRLYETQGIYDKRLEVNRFLIAQYELRYNQEKPEINDKSLSMLSESGWKPIHERTNEILIKKRNEIHHLKDRLDELRLEKESQEFEEIERLRVDKSTKNK